MYDVICIISVAGPFHFYVPLEYLPINTLWCLQIKRNIIVGEKIELVTQTSKSSFCV